MPPLPWPLPAVLAWGLAWLLFLALQAVLPAGAALPIASALPVVLSPLAGNWWRRGLLAAGFPLALLLSGAADVSPWLWLVPLALLLLVYPLAAWRDAPLFPTPHRALAGLGAAAPLPAGAQVLDAGCGLGDGLIALRLAYPQAQFHGLERSRLLAALCALRCPWAQASRGDLWAAHWAGYQLVYLFQRPESMARALAKAQAEMADGTWLVSLEFAVAEASPAAVLQRAGERSVWLYRINGLEKLPSEVPEGAPDRQNLRRSRRFFGR